MEKKTIFGGFDKEDVKNYIEENGYVLISEYKNCKDIIKISCKCNKIWNVRLRTLMQHHFPCEICSDRKIKLGIYTLEDARNFVEIESNSGCKFLSNIYLGVYAFYNFQCRCGNIFNTRLSLFKHENHRCCKECKRNDRLKNKVVTNDRDALKATGEYQKWKISVFERDNYECVCCKNSKNLVAHHIKNFSDNIDLRLNVDNGITMCDSCHNFNKYGSFHWEYGSKNNTKEQLDEYLERYKRGAFKVIKLANLIK